MRKDSKKIKEKIDVLLSFVKEQSKEDNPYIKEYIMLILDLSKKINYRLPKKAHILFCKHCFSLRNLESTKIRVIRHKKNGALQKYLTLHCKECGKIKKINLTKQNS
jgi:RNase P subunit RPR2